MFIEKWQESKPFDPIRDRIIPWVPIFLQTSDASGIESAIGKKSRVFY